MRHIRALAVLASTAAAAAMLLLPPAVAAARPPVALSPDPSGILATVSTGGEIFDRDNPFFQSLGTNGRACITCHVPASAWTLSPAEVRQRFELSRGLDPLFRTPGRRTSKTVPPRASIRSWTSTTRASALA